MGLIYADRVRETSTTTGTGSITLGGAVTGYQSFSAAIGSGNAVYYCIQNQAVPSEWEVGLGTLSTGTTLARTTILASSSFGALVSFGVGTKDVFCTVPAAAVPVEVGRFEARLTLTSGTPVTTADVTGATSVYLTPYKGNRVALFDGNRWATYTLSEISATVSSFATVQFGFTGNTTSGSPTVTGMTSATFLSPGAPVIGTGIPAGTTVKSVDSSAQITLSANATATNTGTSLSFYYVQYDVYLYVNAGTLTLQFIGWTDWSTRLSALVLQDGVLSKNGDTTKRYVGSIRMTSSTGLDDTARQRFVYNYYNRVKKQLKRFETASSWNYTSATLRQANANILNQVEILIGYPESLIDLGVIIESFVSSVAGTQVGISEDNRAAVVSDCVGGLTASSNYALLVAKMSKMPSLGFHYYAWLEGGAAITTCQFYTQQGGGLIGSIDL